MTSLSTMPAEISAASEGCGGLPPLAGFVAPSGSDLIAV